MPDAARMRCPFCGVNDDKVIDSRDSEQGRAVRRRRECKACDKRFTTFEQVEQALRLVVIKRDGRRVPFRRENLLSGLQKACYKRPVPLETLSGIVDDVEEILYRRGYKEVESVEVGRLCIDRLKSVDHVAFLRFASVYLNVEHVDDLLEEIQAVKETLPLPPRPGQGALFQGDDAADDADPGDDGGRAESADGNDGDKGSKGDKSGGPTRRRRGPR